MTQRTATDDERIADVADDEITGIDEDDEEFEDDEELDEDEDDDVEED